VTLPVFSLAALIAPALTRNPLGPITLIVAEIGSQAGWLSDEMRMEQLHSVRDLLQHCLYSDRDILLPRWFHSSGRTVLHRCDDGREWRRGDHQADSRTMECFPVHPTSRFDPFDSYRALDATERTANESMQTVSST